MLFRSFPLVIRHADGRVTDVLYNATVYKDDRGKVRGVFAAARDVTQTKKTSQYTRSLIEASLDPLVTISPDGKVTDVNEATIKVTGVLREKLIGTDFSNYFTDPKKAREGYEQAFKEGYVIDYPLAIHHGDGHVTDVLYNATVYKDEAGKVLGVFAAARNYAKLKSVTEELELANRELEAFSYSISHDLKTPLQVIQGYISIMSEDPKNNALKNSLSAVSMNVEKVSTLTDDILLLSRTSKKQLILENIEMDSVVDRKSVV